MRNRCGENNGNSSIGIFPVIPDDFRSDYFFVENFCGFRLFAPRGDVFNSSQLSGNFVNLYYKSPRRNKEAKGNELPGADFIADVVENFPQALIVASAGGRGETDYLTVRVLLPGGINDFCP